MRPVPGGHRVSGSQAGSTRYFKRHDEQDGLRAWQLYRWYVCLKKDISVLKR